MWEPYREPEESLKSCGWDVLVFVPSLDEEDGLVTCGNAVLGGSQLKCDESTIRIRGIDTRCDLLNAEACESESPVLL